MPLKIIDNIEEYKVLYLTSQDSPNMVDSVDLLFMKGQLKTSKDNRSKFLYPLFKPFAIEVRVLLYGLMDYYELTNQKEIKIYEFCDWLSEKKRYRNYLILLWITNKLKVYSKDSYFFNKTCKKPFESKEQELQSNLQDFNIFPIINKDEYKRSKLQSFTFNKTKMKKTLYILGASAFLDVYDKATIEDRPINEVEELKPNAMTVEMVKLNGAFFSAFRRVTCDNWLF